MLTRRTLGARALGGLALLSPPLLAKRVPRVAAIVTEYRHWSHADVVVGRLLGGNSMNGVWHAPRTRVVSLYTDQVPADDMSRDLAARHGFRIFPTIREALVDIDAVVFIAEHGKYPFNDLGQQLYPRFELFSQVLDAIEANGRPVPIFFDKHFSYSWEKAKAMVDRARKLRVPLMAGSSIPVSVRQPRLQYAIGQRQEAGVSLAYGPQDAYGFHTLEVLECMVERRRETGVTSVQMLTGPAVWQWQDGAGAWSKPLLDAAIAVSPQRTKLTPREAKEPVVFVVNYRDGLRGAAYLLDGVVSDWSFAGLAGGKVEATAFGLGSQGRPLPHFDGLVHCIEDFFLSGRPTHPVERTLLTTGILAAAFESKRRQGALVETPELGISYAPPPNPLIQTA
ncbi:MAG: hypothetical protein K2X03_13765 [Bryobacteraceae bacterium]|nr:hypothetical protein [Bryobacteraceae bacterium]